MADTQPSPQQPHAEGNAPPPAEASAAAPGISLGPRTAGALTIGLLLIAGFFFGYQYLRSSDDYAPEPNRPRIESSEQAAPSNPAGLDASTWAASAPLDELRRVVAAGETQAQAAEAELQAREAIAWQRAQAGATLQSVAAFLSEWPNGAQQGAARARLTQLLGALPVARYTDRVSWPHQTALREAPVSNARVLTYVSANRLLAPEGYVSYDSRYWLVARHADGRRGYIDATGARVSGGHPQTFGATTPTQRPGQTAPPSITPVQPASLIRPAERIGPIRITYPARAQNEVGAVRVSFLVTARGEVMDVRVVSETPPNRGFGDAAVRAVRATRYRPETRDGSPAPSRQTLTLTIQPPER